MPDMSTDQSLIHAQMSRKVDQERERRLGVDAEFEYGGKTFQFGPDSRENIQGATILANIAISEGAEEGDFQWDGPDDFVFLTKANEPIPMDAFQMRQFGRAASNYKAGHIFAARELKNKAIVPDDYDDDRWWP